MDNVVSAINELKGPVIGSVLAGGGVGVVLGYYLGGSAVLFGYGYSLTGGVGGVSFFGGRHLLKSYRKQDDVYNSIFSGLGTGVLFGGRHGLKRIVPLALIGAVSGYTYYTLGDALFNIFRKAWLSHRTELLYEPEKILVQAKRVPPPREGVDEKFRYDEWNWKNQDKGKPK